MSITEAFMLEEYNGEYFAHVVVEGGDGYVFLGAEIDSVDIKIFEGTENTGTETSMEAGRLTLKIPLAPDDFCQIKEDPAIAFEIVNNFRDERMDGLTFDKWIVKSRSWERDVIIETGDTLEGRVMYSFHLPELQAA